MHPITDFLLQLLIERYIFACELWWKPRTLHSLIIDYAKENDDLKL